VFRELKPRSRVPRFSVHYRPYVNVDSKIQLNAERTNVRVSISDLLEGAPAPVHEALAHILLGKLYREPISRKYTHRYRLYLNRSDVRRKALLLRQARGRKQIHSSQGEVYNLAEIFEDLNLKFFGGLLAQPQLTWSRRASRRRLGHFDPAHNAIVISRIFDSPGVPRFLIEYLVYHEMLHLRHPPEYDSHRRCIHTHTFKQEEQQFPLYHEARKRLKEL
jgi:hypothetical protein